MKRISKSNIRDVIGSLHPHRTIKGHTEEYTAGYRDALIDAEEFTVETKTKKHPLGTRKIINGIPHRYVKMVKPIPPDCH